MKRLTFLTGMLVMFFLMAGMGQNALAADEPIKVLQKPINEVMRILQDPAYQDASKKDEQREIIWKIIKDLFDFEKISQLTLGKYRKSFSPEQMKEFTDLFTDLLGNTYLGRMQGEFQNEKVQYLEQKIGGSKSDKAQVSTILARKGAEIPVDYKMWLNNGQWRIYDVSVEKVSLVRNYRDQFNKVLAGHSPDYLINELKQKNESKANAESGS